jgi:hypothetical protein
MYLFCSAWWCTSVIPALKRLRQEDPLFILGHNEFKSSLAYITSPCLKQTSICLANTKKSTEEKSVHNGGKNVGGCERK